MTGKTRTCATIEARMTSARLPGKVLMTAVGKPMLELMVERLRPVPGIDDIIIATTTNTTDDPVVALAERLGVAWFRGSEHDVLSRVLDAAQANAVDVIVEMTGDCPLVDPGVVQQTIDDYWRGGADYVSNALEPRTYPVGMDTQVFATTVLADVAERTNEPDDHEHVSLFIYNNPDIYKVRRLAAPGHHHAPQQRLTLDTTDDLMLIRDIFENLYPANPAFGLTEILNFLNVPRPDGP